MKFRYARNAFKSFKLSLKEMFDFERTTENGNFAES